jgi:hypothetical protein
MQSISRRPQRKMRTLEITSRLRRRAFGSAARRNGLQRRREADFDSETLAEILHQINPCFAAALESFQHRIKILRHELKSTLMTSNRPIEDWGKLIGDVPAATAILDRFLQAAEVVEITGRSFRLKNGGRADEDQKSDDRKNKKKPDASNSIPTDEENS